MAKTYLGVKRKKATFVSSKIEKLVKKHIPDDGIVLTQELTELFTQLLVQASSTAIQIYMKQGIVIDKE